ncbi:hypothetical protein ACOIX7_02610 [Bacillus cereus]|uniref:hypothetical protein n=1 Tax=Bacillus cereus TaxID=1396 RepID=UPI003CF4230C
MTNKSMEFAKVIRFDNKGFFTKQYKGYDNQNGFLRPYANKFKLLLVKRLKRKCFNC